MVTMVDEIFDRNYQAGRAALHSSVSRGLGQLGHAIHDAFEVLVNIEYHAPWAAKRKQPRCN
jgi:hypothetical protein